MNGAHSERAVILAPRGRDAEIAGAIMGEAAIESVAAANLARLVDLLEEGAAFAVLTDEVLVGADLRGIDHFLKAQSEWSDFPFILLTERGGSIERNPAAGRYLDLLGNVTFLERPFHPTSLVSAAKAALRGRRRQYDARARLEEIREGEQQLRIAFAAGKLGAWSFDVAAMRLAASRECKAQYGRDADEDFTYADLVAVVHSDDRQLMNGEIRRSLATGDDYDIEYRCIWPDTSLHWVQVRGRPQFDAAGRILGMTGVSQDITARKTAEETLRNFAAELEQRVAERTREYADAMAQLHEAQKLETLGQLTGGVAHDFNNLLTPIVGSLDLIRQKISDDRLLKLVDGALQASERARTLVARLLAFARRQNLETLPVDVAALIEGMADLIQRSVGPTIALDVSVGAATPAAMVDPHQLELALLNLAINARDAMANGGRLQFAVDTMAIGADDSELRPGDYVRISVTDNGEGMASETLARAIEPFYSTKGIGRGTGLGLSMVHGLAAQSGGRLQLKSKVGAGTTAAIWLPAAANAVQPNRRPAEDAIAAMLPLAILLVDDEEPARSSTAAILEDMGHQVVQAESGQQALAALRTRAFDLIVTDYLMPAMNGLELAAEARKLRLDIPILMVTGFADLAAIGTAPVMRLPKPFRVAELGRAMREAMSAQREPGLAL